MILNKSCWSSGRATGGGGSDLLTEAERKGMTLPGSSYDLASMMEHVMHDAMNLLFDEIDGYDKALEEQEYEDTTRSFVDKNDYPVVKMFYDTERWVWWQRTSS